MRAEVTELRGGATIAPRPQQPIVTVVKRRQRLDRFELALLVAFACASLWVLALDLWQVVAHGRVWTGTDGFFIVDQMQYLAWVRSASHGLIANMFVLHWTPADYFQPAIAISGLVTALGVAPWLSLLLWKPVAVAGTFFAFRAYAHRSLFARPQRRAALALALFFGSFSIVYGSFSVVGDLFPTFLTWGYPFGLIAVAAMVFALLIYDRARSADRVPWTPALLGALASSLHPWQGELLILIVVGAELYHWRDRRWTRRALTLPALTLLGTVVPLLYYVILGRIDTSWALAREASKHAFPFTAIAIGLAPLALLAALGYRGRPKSFLATVTRVWPLAALLVYLLSATALSATPLHAFEGITLPLAVLAVDGLRRASRRRRIPGRRTLAIAAIAAATIPATLYLLHTAAPYVAPQAGNANFITRDESSALSYLARDPVKGGVLTRFYLGEIVPERADRRTLVGNCLWSQPHCLSTAYAAQRLFDGALSPASARSFVQSTGARFLLVDCETPTNLQHMLAALIVSTQKFGCASVYQLDSPTRRNRGPDGP